MYGYRNSAPYPKSFKICQLSETQKSTYNASELSDAETIVFHVYCGKPTVAVSVLDSNNLSGFTFSNRYHRLQLPIIHPKHRKESSLWKCPQWPWIFATMSLLGITSDIGAFLRLNHLLWIIKPSLVQDEEVRSRGVTDRHVIYPQESGESVLSKFTAPLFPNSKQNLWKFTMDLDELEEWQSYVGSIIGY